MDKAEYRIKLEQINSLAEAGDFKGAAAVADTIDWRHVKSVRTLCMVGEIYEANKRYEDSKRILQYAYKRSSISKTVLYRLAEINIRLGDYDEAKRYYNEFEQLSPHDTSRYILKYKLLRAEGATLDDQIAVLKEYKEREYTERWAYELAKLYMKNGQTQKCVEECDEMILWFAEGKFVTRAMELKMQVRALSDPQKKKYSDRISAAEESNAEEIQESKTPESPVSKDEEAVPEEEEQLEEVEEKKKFSSIDAIKKMEAAADETVSSALSGSRPNVMPSTRQGREYFYSRKQSLASEYAQAAAKEAKKPVEQKVTEASIAASAAAVKEIEAAAEAAVQSIGEKVEAAIDDIGVAQEETVVVTRSPEAAVKEAVEAMEEKADEAANAAEEAVEAAEEKAQEAVVTVEEKADEAANAAEEAVEAAEEKAQEAVVTVEEKANETANAAEEAVEAAEEKVKEDVAAVEADANAAAKEAVATVKEDVNAAEEAVASVAEEVNTATAEFAEAADEAIEAAEEAEDAEETAETVEEAADEIVAEETIEVAKEVEEILAEEAAEETAETDKIADEIVKEETSQVAKAVEEIVAEEVAEAEDAAVEKVEAMEAADAILAEETVEVARDVEPIVEANAEAAETEVLEAETAVEVEAAEAAEEADVAEAAEVAEEAEVAEAAEAAEVAEEAEVAETAEAAEAAEEAKVAEIAEAAEAAEEAEVVEVTEEIEETVAEAVPVGAAAAAVGVAAAIIEESAAEEAEEEAEEAEEAAEEAEEEAEEAAEEAEEAEEEAEEAGEKAEEEAEEVAQEAQEEAEESETPTPEDIARSADEEAEKALQEMMASFLNEFAVSGSEYRMTGEVLPDEDNYDYDDEEVVSDEEAEVDEKERMLGKETDESLGLTRTESFQEQLKKALEAGGNYEEASQIVISQDDFMTPEEAAKRTVMSANGLEYDPDAEDTDAEGSENAEDAEGTDDEAAENAEGETGSETSDEEGEAGDEDEAEDKSEYESEEVLNELVADEEDLQKGDTSSLTDIVSDGETETVEEDAEIVEQIMAEPEILELVEVLPRPFTEEERALFTYFTDIPGISEQVTLALADIHNNAGDKTSRSGNVLVMGRQVSGKTRLAEALVRAACMDLNIKAVKLAKVIGEDLNGRDPAEIVDRMAGGFLIIEGAGSLNDEFVEGLNKAMEFRTDNLVVILEDERGDLMDMLEKHPEFAGKFTSTIIVPVFTNDELVTFARTYAKEMGYKLDEMATLALYTMIGENQKDSEPVVIGKVKKMIDQAIERSKGSKFTALFRKNAAAEDGRIWLREKDFGS